MWEAVLLKQERRLDDVQANDLPEDIANKIKMSSEVKRSFLDMLENLKLHDQITYEHSLRVAKKVRIVARRLFPDNLKLQDEFFLAGLLHDIGKIKVDQKILQRPTRDLTPQEWQNLHSHNRLGFQIIEEALKLPRIARIALGHHGESRNGKERRQNELKVEADRRRSGERRQKSIDQNLAEYSEILTIIDQEDALLDKSRPYKSHEVWVIHDADEKTLNNEQDLPVFHVGKTLHNKFPDQKKIIDLVLELEKQGKFIEKI